MAEQSLRFVVSDYEHRAASWKIWTRTGQGKHDVYLACRSLGGTLKASLHGSDSWHVGFLQSFLSRELDADHLKQVDPYIERWPRPPEIGHGVTLAYRLLVPTSAVNIPISDSLPDSTIRILAAPKGKAVEIAVIITTPDTKITDWPARRSMNTELVGKLALENAETIWVVHRTDDVPPLPGRTGNATWFKSGREVGMPEGNIRGIVFGSHEDGSRFMIECAVDASKHRNLTKS
jgi:hypothetical protein